MQHIEKMIIFLDRDGTINRNFKEEPVYRIDLFELLPGVSSAIRILNDLGVRVVVVSNQGGINHKNRNFDWETYRLIEKEMHKMLKNEADAYVDDVFICYHADYEKCGCRKPETGLLEQAQKKYDFVPKHSFIIGDSTADIIAGKRYGLQTILVQSGWKIGVAEKLAEIGQPPDKIFPDLFNAVTFVKKQVMERGQQV